MRANFQALQDGTPGLNWKYIQAARSMDEVEQEIRSVVMETMDAARQQPLGNLW